MSVRSKHIYMSLEIPHEILDLVHPLVDFHFVIATELRDNPAYHQWYVDHQKYSDRKYIMLDNGLYETGQPMENEELLYYATTIGANAVCAPDWFGDGDRTLGNLEDFLRGKPRHMEVVFIPQGPHALGIVDCLRKALDTYGETINWIGLSFLNDRATVVALIQREGLEHKYNVNWHYLGLRSLDELHHTPWWITSYDTVKPIKAAHFGIEVETMPRGLGKWNSNMKVASENLSLMFRNIAKLRMNNIGL